jgi:CheY-like chemotaxis protein
MLTESLSKFVKKQTIMVVDDSITIRTSISSVLNELGIPASQLILVSNYSEALTFQSRWTEVCLLISDYSIGNHSGVELAVNVFAAKQNLAEVITVILTGSANQSSVVEAAEGLADAYVLKPFSADSFKKYLNRALNLKLNAGENEKAIYEIRSKLWNKQYQDVVDYISSTLEVFSPEKPAVYYVYLGQAYEGLSQCEAAKSSYFKALQYQKRHYLALFGVYQIYYKMGEKDKAYEIAANIAAMFPLSPQRLCEIVSLAIETRHFDHIERYYQEFLTLDERREDLLKAMTAALVVGGIHNLQKADPMSGMDLFRKAIMTSRRNPEVIFRSILYCFSYGRIQEAQEFFGKFESQDMSRHAYEVSKFLINNQKNSREDIEKNLVFGLKLIKSGQNCPVQVYRIISKRSKEIGNESIYENVTGEASRFFSEKYLNAELYYMNEEEEKRQAVVRV